jgi:phosphate starvation-inducible PhoH-like protein
VSERSRHPRATQRHVVRIANPQLLREVCGPAHSNLQLLERSFSDHDLQAESQGGTIVLSGLDDAPRRAAEVLEAFVERIAAGAEASASELEAALRLSQSSGRQSLSGDVLSGLRRPVMAQTPGQRAYLETLRRDDLGLVFGVGPAGTGKTFLAVAAGAAELKAGKRERLIVARPAVEAGEKLGFLPGALEEKVDPYMLPIWDSLNECLGAQEVERRKERKEIEVAPLAFMRGRTLKNAFVIIDEAQNATVPQMKMVLTRLGRGSRMIVTGDPSQTDLPEKTPSGLAHAIHILRNIPGVAMEEMTSADVVRHELVAQIVQAYDRDAALSGAGRRV